ncbi:MAG: hypothetical protein GF421_03900 [Candidatus Aminicenantes bacterium]|nr:hypothetical protein [Candidatus Aminicenantes bacterium]
MKKLNLLVCVVLALSLLSGVAEASFKGYMFGDFYYVASHNNEDYQGRNGFWFRRIYFSYNPQLTEKIKMRLRLEMSSPGDFDESAKMTPVVKDAWLNADIGGGQNLVFGLVSTPTWGSNVEDIWGYRSLEKTPLDLMKMGSSRDFGIGLQGDLDKNGTVSYNLLFGNGASNKSETNKGKKFYGSLAFKPAEGLLLEVYGDYETVDEDENYYVYQGFACYQGGWGRIGLLYANRHYNKNDNEFDLGMFSGFAVISASDKMDIIARYDKMLEEPVQKTVSYIPFSKAAPSNMIIGGISYEIADSLWIIPNVKYVFYDDPDVGETPGDDAYINLTFWWKFK